jgi:hypothetical protein
MRRLLLAAATVAATLALAAPAGAITFGQLDGSRHPNVGALFANWDPDSPGQDLLCTGTLIAPKVFLTAAHCVDFLPSEGVSLDDVFVTFDSAPLNSNLTLKSSTTLLGGTAIPHPRFGPGGGGDAHDIAVIKLDSRYTAATPARLPRLNQLGSMNLHNQRFTAVGYGDAREIKQSGPNSFFFDGKRRFVTQSFNTINKVWLKLDMNPSHGEGGTCFGDSGGPHFLGAGASETNVVVSLTVTGDSSCRSTDTTYRTDTASARAFLDDFVALP